MQSYTRCWRVRQGRVLDYLTEPVTAHLADFPAPCASELTSTNSGTDQASGPASAAARNDVAIQTGAASTNSRGRTLLARHSPG